MPIDLSIEPFEKAIVSLEVALDRHAQDSSDDLVRDACIQRFEFTYELAHKMLKRFLEATSANPDEFDNMTFQDLIRSGNERGLLRSDELELRLDRAQPSVGLPRLDRTGGLQQRLRIGTGQRHRLFHQHMLARAQGGCALLGMQHRRRR